MKAIREKVVAPIPAGSEVLIVVLENTAAGMLDLKTLRLVVDRTHRVVYGDMWSETGFRNANLSIVPADDPAGALGPTWKVKESYRGTLTCATIVNHETILYFLDEVAETYR